MITNTLLIDKDELIEYISMFNINLDYEKIRTTVKLSQDMYTRSILGDKLYFDLLENFENNTLSPEYDDLLLYVKQHLTFRVAEESTFFIHNQLTRKGIQKNNSDYSNPSSDSDLFRTINLYKKNAEFYENRLYSFLKENETDYPLWKDKSYDINSQKPDQDFGLFLI
jgi:hypothetical protein